MRSKDRSERLDLARGLPTTAGDVAALRALRYSRMTDEDYIRFLTALQISDPATLREKPGPGGEPFRL